MLEKLFSQTKGFRAPELVGISDWINSKPLEIHKDLKGKIVLVDFWAYSCINCIRTLKYINEWHKKYASAGLVIIGVHSPEFEFERKKENVQMAVKKFGIEYPVCLDNDFKTWRAYNNHHWPHKYIINTNGNIVYDHVGEGGYEESEEVIQKLLEKIGQNIKEELTKETQIPYSAAQTPELYFGYHFARKGLGNTQGFRANQVVDYSLPKEIKEDTIYMEGKWQNNVDHMRHADKKKASTILSFRAKTLNIVANARKAIVEVFLNDKPINKERAGEDVVFDKSKGYIIVDRPKLYNVVGNKNQYGSYKLKLVTKNEGFEIYSYTFGG